MKVHQEGGEPLRAPAPAEVPFPFRSFEDLPADIAAELFVGCDDAGGLYETTGDRRQKINAILRDVRARKLRYKDRHTAQDWADVVMLELRERLGLTTARARGPIADFSTRKPAI